MLVHNLAVSLEVHTTPMSLVVEQDKKNPVPVQDEDVMPCYNEGDKTVV